MSYFSDSNEEPEMAESNATQMSLYDQGSDSDSNASESGNGRNLSAHPVSSQRARVRRAVNAARGRDVGPGGNGRRGRICGRRGRGRGQQRQAAPVAPVPPLNFKSYNDPDVPNVLPAFQPARPVGVHLDQPFLRATMTTALEFFRLFFTIEMVKSIVLHTNSYAVQKLSAGTHHTYATSDGFWRDTTEDEIMKVIALLIYFGLVRARWARVSLKDAPETV